MDSSRPQVPVDMPSFSLCYIDRLPFELLSNVFILGEVMYGEDWRQDRYGGYSLFQSVISSVSKRWRSVAIATPMLWTRLRVVGPRTLERAVVWAKQSRQRDLDVALMLSHPGDMKRALERIDSASHRISTLLLSTLSRYGAAKIIEMPHLPASLRNLRFKNVRFQDWDGLRSALAACSKLESLDLTTCVDDGTTLSLGEIAEAPMQLLFLKNLVDLVLPPNELASKVRRYLVAPTLKRVSFHGSSFPPSPPNTLTVCFPCTESDGLPALDPFLDVLPLFPEVEELNIHLHARSGAGCLAQAISCLLQSVPDYPLPQEDLSNEQWIATLQVRLPHLHTIRLHNVTRSEERALLLLVTRLHWAFDDLPPFTSRPCPLEKVVLFGRKKSDALSASIAKVKELGLPVEEDFDSSRGDAEDEDGNCLL